MLLRKKSILLIVMVLLGWTVILVLTRVQSNEARAMGLVTLEIPNNVDVFLANSDFARPNSVYRIDKEYIIPSGCEINVGENVVLLFEGGSISGEGTLHLNHTELAGYPRIYSNVTGTVSGFVFPEWFKYSKRTWDEVFNTICNFQCEVRLKSNTIYHITKPVYTGYSCYIKGGTNSTMHFEKCSTCIYVGHSNKLQDFNITITNPKGEPVALEIYSEHLGNTVVNGFGNQLPFSFYYGSLLNIMIERVNINYHGDKKYYKGYGIKMFANRKGQNGWNIKVSECVICGHFDYAVYVLTDDTKTVNPSSNQAAWLNDLYFYDNRIVRAKNGFYFGRRGSSKCVPPQKVLICGCSMQGGEGHPFFINADCVRNLSVRDCMEWDWTENGGKAYRFTPECRAVEVTGASFGYVYDGDKAEIEKHVVFNGGSTRRQSARGSSLDRKDLTKFNDGDVFFDTNLKKPLWKFGDKWYDANGTEY